MTIKIVFAEDEEHIGRMVEFKLQKEGFETFWAKDGVEALKIVSRELPDLVLLDIMMPKMNGLEVLEAIKGNDQLKSIPVVMLTAKGQESDVVAGIDKGAADYIIKPFRPAELVARIKRLVAVKPAGG
ncbi:response regulator [bacterium]|nr:response regulator [bacterium]